MSSKEVTVQKRSRWLVASEPHQDSADGGWQPIEIKADERLITNDTIVVRSDLLGSVTILHVANGRLFGGIERMLTTFAECGGTNFEFVVATEGRLLSGATHVCISSATFG